MKVLYVIDSLRPGGKERQAVALLCGLVAHGHQPQVITMGTDRFFAPDLERVGIPIHTVLRRSKRDLQPCFTVNKIIRDCRPDVVHSTCRMTTFFSLLGCRKNRVPLVNGSIRNSFAHGGLKWHSERLLLRLADARIANSQAGFRSRGFDSAVRGNHVVYNGFDGSRLETINSAVVQEIQGIARGRKIVGMVAQFKNDKDYPTFLSAASRIAQQRNDCVFVTVGDGINWERLRSEYGSQPDRILFLGRRTDVESIVSTFFLGVLATFTEGISNAIMEFMALSKPVVATDGGGTCELLLDGATGWLVPPRDVEALERRIVYFLDHPQDAALFGQRGRDRIRDVFSYDALIRSTTAVYSSLVVKAVA